MNQATLELHRPAAAAVDRTGFDVGWDHARHRLAPLALLADGASPVCQGWMAGRAFYGRRRSVTTRATRQWLQLRLQAWQDGVGYDRDGLGAAAIEGLHVASCPLLRQPLGGRPCDAAAPVIDRIDRRSGYTAGGVAMISREAALLRQGLGRAEAMRRARLAEVTGQAIHGHGAAVWWRLAVLDSFGTSLSAVEAARLPLALLPPPGVWPAQPIQILQAKLTLEFATPGWSARTRRIGAALPADDLRHDFNWFVGALAPRVIDAGARPASMRQVLEDAWLHERVQRRWQHFATRLDESGASALLPHVGAAGKAAG